MEIGKDAAEKSKGLFSADDWMCTKYDTLKLKLYCAKSNILLISDVGMLTGPEGELAMYAMPQDLEKWKNEQVKQINRTHLILKYFLFCNRDKYRLWRRLQ